eukprot:scaffold25291_cov101-Isochrysis_galbana.AAC.1
MPPRTGSCCHAHCTRDRGTPGAEAGRATTGIGGPPLTVRVPAADPPTGIEELAPPPYGIGEGAQLGEGGGRRRRGPPFTKVEDGERQRRLAHARRCSRRRTAAAAGPQRLEQGGRGMRDGWVVQSAIGQSGGGGKGPARLAQPDKPAPTLPAHTRAEDGGRQRDAAQAGRRDRRRRHERPGLDTAR